IISHDRYLLDRLCDRIVEVESTKLTAFPGNYSNYAKTKALRALTAERQFAKDAEFIRKEREFIEKNIYARRTKDARGRRKRLERRLEAGEFVTEAPRGKRSARFTFETSDSKPATEVATVLRADGLSMRFDDNVLFEDLSMQVPRGERFGITGPNGTGKTTLLRIALGRTAPTGGEVLLDPRVSVGYYAQEHVELDPNRMIVDEIRAACPGFSEHDARSYLGRYRFSGDDVFKTLGSLSGGEQSRVRLAVLILERPDVLILDEPTNHLDIPSRETLEEALQEFGGTIIVVSHDRYFLDRVVNRLLVIRREGHKTYDGNYSFYAREAEQAEMTARATRAEERRAARRRETARKRSKSGPSPYDRLSVEELEAMVIERETALAALRERFGDPELYKDLPALERLKKEIQEAEDKLDAIDEAWQERADSA
ncbi:MAG: ATP-binding cassette domain-containing protein, partial [Phycisphaerae bacterium]